jgi:amino acid permease
MYVVTDHRPQVGKWGALVLMTKANLGLGVLALPSIFGVLGLVPGIILIIVVQTLIACE